MARLVQQRCWSLATVAALLVYCTALLLVAKPASGAACAAYAGLGGQCGSSDGDKCCPSGQCCSRYGNCGVTTAHCGTGCQAAYGTCTAGSPETSGGCPDGWLPAVGTVYDSWPKPGSVTCVQYNRCERAGQFTAINDGDAPPCKNGAQWLDGGDGVMACRFPEATVKAWNLASTYDLDAALFGRQLEVMALGALAGRTVVVNVRDVCNDNECRGCCKHRTGNKAWKLINIEKWPASQLLGFDPTVSGFDVRRLKYPWVPLGLRAGAPEGSVMPLCYRDLGPAPELPHGVNGLQAPVDEQGVASE
ncbi:hypothetical protein Agub_g3365 [Astrephomene gubernaculifera]|uniref:Chitin-binding type-1 domain-containing protein n=1 Tax=Astrephomene gubernaculifera TaxID=47775 RepID=A0AAD3DKT7_9CHLO|nr:hypothetical protein Agub_g3365 [Astrephomene gubernaculifera]